MGTSRRLAPLLALLVVACGGGERPEAAPTPPPPAAHPSPAPAASGGEDPVVVSNATAPPTEDPTELGPLDVLEAFTAAQEAGDFGWAQSHVVSTARGEWDELAQQMSEDDLVSSGLAFRQEDYQLDFHDERMAVFWSSSSRLHLVMTREDGAWRIDPRKTDEMNVERASP